MHDADLADRIRPHEQVPAGQSGCGGWAEVGEHKAAKFLHRIRLQLLPDFAARRGFHRPLDTLSPFVEEPAVIRATQAAFVRNAELQIDIAMQATVADEAERAALVLVQHEVFAQHADLAYRVVVELRIRRNRNPVAAHQFAAGRARTHAREALVHCCGQHVVSRYWGAIAVLA